MPDREVLDIESEAVAHRCVLCDETEFAGYGLPDNVVRYLTAAHADILDAERTVQAARRRLHNTSPLAPIARELWASQERNALAAIERIQTRMRRVIAGEPDPDGIDLWGSAT